MIKVEVAYALPDRQKIIELMVADGTTAFDAVEQSGMDKIFPQLGIMAADMGVFGKMVKPREYVLTAGDRVEVYRPLIVDPKEVRKARAEKAKAAKSK